jgi:hypothetical protein
LITTAGPATKPVCRPLPEQLSLAITLAIWPRYTSRAKTLDEKGVSDSALRFLNNFLETIGPINGGFKEAFRLEANNRRTRRAHSQQSQESDEENQPTLTSALAHDKSLFAIHKDGNLVVWRLLGWAFNCSVMWPKRWEYWEPILQFLVNLFEQDLEETKRLVDEQSSVDPLETSLFLNALYTPDNHRSIRRRMVHAILADGENKHSKEFGVFIENETKEPKVKERSKKKIKLDLNADRWGDYDGDEDEDMIEDTILEDDDTDFEKNEEPILAATSLRARFLELVRINSACPLRNILIPITDD